MSKERLEEIKEEYEWHVENQLLPRTSDDNFEWLIEQAERVQELEEELNRYKEVVIIVRERNEEIRGQNKLYREALEDIRDISTTSPHNFAVKALEESQ